MLNKKEYEEIKQEIIKECSKKDISYKEFIKMMIQERNDILLKAEAEIEEWG